MRRILTGLVLILMLTGGAAAGPLEDGVRAYLAGDYATALRILRPLAEQGDDHKIRFTYEPDYQLFK